MTDKLRVLYNAEAQPEWGESEIEDLHKAIDAAVNDGDHVCLIALSRDAQGTRIAKSYRMRRGARTSVYELLGAVQAAIIDWLGDP